MLKYVGKNIIKEDSYQKVTGETKYIADMQKHNMLYARLLLSEKPNAKIKINIKDAIKLDGITAIYTYKDTPKIKYNSYIWYPGVDAVKDEYLLSNKALFVGDRIAVVVGESLTAVNKALKKIKVIYDEQPPTIGIDNAKKNVTIVKGKTNLAFKKEINCGDITNTYDNSIVIEDTGTTPKNHHAAMEPHICLAEKDDNGDIVVWTPCQGVFQVQTIISEAIDIPFHKIRVIKTVMGGSFGGKGQPILEPICAFLADKLNKPVKLIMDRNDAILATRTRNATKINVKTTVDKRGTILAREILADIDCGAYHTNATAVIMSMSKKVFRLYNIKDQKFTGKSFYTNTLVGGGFRGYGSPQVHAITEINIDNIAKKINMDPCEFRLKNLVNPYDKDPTGGPDLGNAQIKKCIEVGMKDFNWINKRKNIAKQNTDRYSYGVGMACGAHGNGYKGSFPDYTDVNITISYDGIVVIKIGAHDQGCGTVLTLKQIAAEVLNIPIDKIYLSEADTFVTPYDSAGTQASRVTYVTGGAVKASCEALLENIKTTYAKINNCKQDEIIFEDGIIKYKNNSCTLKQFVIIVEKEYNKRIMVDTHYESPGNPGTYAACFTTVKVDKYTGHVDILECTAIHDIGQCINPILAEGQVQGGAHFALGMAIREDILIDDSGYVSSNNFSKYHVLNATEMPDVKVIMIEDFEETGPYGAKSVGEMAAVAPAPAVMNAINFALDTNITSYPATPEVIIEQLAKISN